MTKPQSQISQVLWEIAAEFCPRIIVIDGLIQCVSTIGHSDFLVNKLWLPSSIQLISSKNFSKTQSIKSIVIENQSTLKIIESEAFQQIALQYFTVPALVEVLCANCFSQCGSLSSVTFEFGSRLSRIEEAAFTQTGLLEIIVPSSVEVLSEKCFF
jgi:hypothetical protein